VLESIAAEAPDTIWCLGDLVGYGPRPNECCALAAERMDVCLIGNHDLAVLGGLDLAEFAPDAAASAEWTASVLEAEPRAYLESLESTATREGVGLYHASPRDPVWEYVLSPAAALGSLVAVEDELVLVGHSHVALWFELVGEGLDGGLAPNGTDLELAAGGRWLLNPGSVGQPRDGDARAAWLVLDLDERRARYVRVPYPIERTQAEIGERGLPEALAERLAHGL
jgi:diadenosine tetraphosphatase ApaH/serine/threonine PP2A family protein phosphatase